MDTSILAYYGWYTYIYDLWLILKKTYSQNENHVNREYFRHTCLAARAAYGCSYLDDVWGQCPRVLHVSTPAGIYVQPSVITGGEKSKYEQKRQKNNNKKGYMVKIIYCYWLLSTSCTTWTFLVVCANKKCPYR